MTDEITKQIDAASAILIELWQSSKSTEIADILDMLSAYREEYVESNDQFGVGA